MELLSNALSRLINRVVIDRTGLTGYYEVTLEFTPEPGSGLPAGALPPDFRPPPTDAPSLFTALREELGLRLEPDRGPVRVLVIDEIERPSVD